MPEPAELEKMIQKCMKDKGWTREHCQRYIAGGIWGKEFMTPTPSDVHIPSASPKVSVKTKKKKKDETFAISSIPIFKAGNWKETTYTIEDLDEIVRNTNSLIVSNLLEPPVKLGHSEEQEFLQRDGYPSAGYVVNVYRLGDQLFADVIDVPKKITELIEKRAYSKVSAEIYNNFEHPETKENIGKVLRAIALLGADIPAVKGLGDITRLYHKEGEYNYITFSEKDLEEVNKMSNVWTLKDVENYFPCCVKEVKKFMEEKKVDSIETDELANIIAKVRLEKFQEEKQEPKCPPGFKWDEVKGICLPVSETEKTQQQERKVCPEGYRWDDALQKCVVAEVKIEKPEDKKTEKGEDKEDKKSNQEGNPDPKILEKKPEDWTPEEIKDMYDSFEKDRKAGGTRGKEIAEEMKKKPEEQSENFQAERPPKDWWDKCVSSVSKNPDITNPEALCGWIWYHHMIGAPYRKSDEGDQKITQLMEKIKKLETEKIDSLIKELKEKNRGILLPRFDGYIQTFSEVFNQSEKVVKFGEEDISLKELFYKFLKEIVNSKVVIFKELAKTPPKDELKEFSISAEYKNALIERYSELGKGRDVRNIELSKLAEKIEKEQNISYRDALLIASKILNEGGKK